MQTSAAANKESIQAWDDIAWGYDQFVTDTEIWLASQALERVDLQAGQSFLDVAAGVGGLGLPAARLGAQVVAIDWSSEMIKGFNRKVESENLTSASGIVMDGHDLAFEDNSFDIAGSQFGVMLFSDMPKALREMVRVTKPGGKVVLVVYGPPQEVEFLKVLVTALKSVRPQFEGLPSDPPPKEFQAADPEVLSQRLQKAGLAEVQVDTVTEKLEFDTGLKLWDWIVHGNPIVGHVLSMLGFTNDEIKMVKQELDHFVSHQAGERGHAILSNQIHIGYGMVQA